MKTAVIDGNSLCKTRFEANYAMAKHNGYEVTEVDYIKGFTSFLYQDVLNRFPGYSFDNIVIVFDAEGENLRNKVYPEYKANRTIDAKHPFISNLTEEYLAENGLKDSLRLVGGIKLKNINPTKYDESIEYYNKGNIQEFITTINILVDELNVKVHAQRDEYLLKSKLFKDASNKFKKLLSDNDILFTELAGFEGDDLINTFVKRSIKETDSCVIFTGDRDLHQLITHNISVSSIRYSTTGERKTTITKLSDLDGNSSGQHILFEKMLVGDSADNLPGIYKVGPKKANEIMQFGTNADEVLSNVNTPIKIKQIILENYKELEILKAVIELKYLSVEIPTTAADDFIKIFKRD